MTKENAVSEPAPERPVGRSPQRSPERFLERLVEPRRPGAGVRAIGHGFSRVRADQPGPERGPLAVPEGGALLRAWLAAARGPAQRPTRPAARAGRGAAGRAALWRGGP